MLNRTKVFISYSHEDEDWLKRLRVHLRPLEREYDIEIWDDKKIKAGSRWREEIESAVSSARVAVLLISASFLASDFITTDELPPLLDAAEKEGATILPVIISASRFLRTSNLSQFQAVNSPSAPLIDLPKGEQEAILEKVTEAIEASLQLLPKPRPFLSEKDSLKDTTLATTEGDNSIAKKESQPVLARFYKRHRYTLIIGTIVILSALAVWIARMNGKLPAGNLPGALILLGIIVAVFIWLPFRVSVKWFTLTQPRQLRHRLLVFILGVLILASGVYLFAQGFNKSTLSEPTLHSYFAYITLAPIDPPTGFPTPTVVPSPKVPPNCHIIYHVALRFEVPEGQQAVYVDRITSGGGGIGLDSNPSRDVLNNNQWPGNPTRLDFKIEEKQQPSRFLDIEAVAFLDTVVTRERAKIGPHLPYRAEFVVVIVDYSRMKFSPPPSDIWGQLEFLGPDGVSRTEKLGVVSHPDAKDGTVTLVGRNLPAESHLLIRWGAMQ
jgi:hypothetical protein